MTGFGRTEKSRRRNSIARLGYALLVASICTSSQAAPLGEIVKELQGRNLDDVRSQISKLPKSDQQRLSSAIRFDPRIVGGVAVDIKDYPWQVALVRGYAADPVRSQFCGGTLISPTVVLTAAHCVDNGIVRNDASRVNVVSGTSMYVSGGERIQVEAIFVHPKWDASNNNYDFALLRLSKASTLGQAIQIGAQAPVPGQKALVSGWGALSEGGNGSPDLMAAQIPIVSATDCNSPDSYNNQITAQMLCAGERDGGVDSCQGDSGGPLVSADQKKLIGVVSFGEGCARKLKYGVYSRVTEAVDWMKSFGDPSIVISEGAGPSLAAPAAQPLPEKARALASN